jgi:hypothetical protein
MTFGDRTPSRGDPNTAHFYTKVQVWGRMVRTSPYVPSIPKVTLVKKKKNDDSSVLLKKRKKEI